MPTVAVGSSMLFLQQLFQDMEHTRKHLMSGYAELVRLLDTRRARAVILASRNAPTHRDHDADPTLVDIVEQPFDSIEGMHRRLSELETQLRANMDRRAVFLTIYRRMTRAVQTAIENGDFHDPAWMRRYTVMFAEYYRCAFLAFERGNSEAVPDPWQVAFETALSEQALIAQDAFLGINAHINYDLALALRDVGLDPDRPQKRLDHRKINDILAGLVDAQQEALVDLYAPGLESVDASLGRFDEQFSLFSMAEGREQAWRIAVVLTDVGWAPVRAYARWVLRVTATGGAFFVRSPPVDPNLLRTLRRVERDQFSLDDALSRLDSQLDAFTDDRQ